MKTYIPESAKTLATILERHRHDRFNPLVLTSPVTILLKVDCYGHVFTEEKRVTQCLLIRQTVECKLDDGTTAFLYSTVRENPDEPEETWLCETLTKAVAVQKAKETIDGYECYSSAEKDESFLKENGFRRLTGIKDCIPDGEDDWIPETELERVTGRPVETNTSSDQYFVAERDGYEFYILVHYGQWYVGCDTVCAEKANIHTISDILDDYDRIPGCILNITLPSFNSKGEPETTRIITLKKHSVNFITVLSESQGQRHEYPLQSYGNEAVNAITQALINKPCRLLLAVGELRHTELFVDSIADGSLDIAPCIGTEDETEAIRKRADAIKTGETLELEYLDNGQVKKKTRDETLADVLAFDIYAFDSKDEAERFKKHFYEGFIRGADYCYDLQSRSRHYVFLKI